MHYISFYLLAVRELNPHYKSRRYHFPHITFTKMETFSSVLVSWGTGGWGPLRIPGRVNWHSFLPGSWAIPIKH